MALTEYESSLKQQLIDSGEEWSETWQNILALDLAYFTAYVGLRQVPIQKQKLSRKIQELVMLAVDASCTHLFQPGIELHTAAAIKAGATKEEIMETLELASVLGVHAVNVGVPLLEEVLAEKGEVIATDLDDRRLRLKANFERQRGYWSVTWDPVLALSPDFFEAYTKFSSVPFQPGHRALSLKTKELIYCAIDCATTHLYQPGLKLHIRNALDQGATKEEVMEVFELAALMGVHTVMRGASVLQRQIDKAR